MMLWTRAARAAVLGGKPSHPEEAAMVCDPPEAAEAPAKAPEAPQEAGVLTEIALYALLAVLLASTVALAVTRGFPAGLIPCGVLFAGLSVYEAVQWLKGRRA